MGRGNEIGSVAQDSDVICAWALNVQNLQIIGSPRVRSDYSSNGGTNPALQAKAQLSILRRMMTRSMALCGLSPLHTGARS